MNCLMCEKPLQVFTEVRMPSPEMILFPPDGMKYNYCRQCKTWSKIDLVKN